MASLRQRPGPDGRRVWQVKIRRKGWSPQSATFEIKAQAEVCSRQIEGKMDRGVFVSRAALENTTLSEALTRYLAEVTPGKKPARSTVNG